MLILTDLIDSQAATLDLLHCAASTLVSRPLDEAVNPANSSVLKGLLQDWNGRAFLDGCVPP